MAKKKTATTKIDDGDETGAPGRPAPVRYCNGPTTAPPACPINPAAPPMPGSLYVLAVPKGAREPARPEKVVKADRVERWTVVRVDGRAGVLTLADADGPEFTVATTIDAFNDRFAPFITATRCPGEAGGVGRFDRENPWPEGTLIVFDDAHTARLVEIDWENDTLGLHHSSDLGSDVVDIDYWNRVECRTVVGVSVPEGAAEPDNLDAKPSEIEGKPSKPAPAAPPRADLVLIPIDQVDATHNVRQAIDEAPLLQLTASIKQLGMIEPVVVRKLTAAEAGGAGARKFRLVAGHRRMEAARRAGEEFVEAKIYSGVDDAWEAMARLAENVQRRDLTHMELARVFNDAVQAGLSVRQVAEEANVSDDMVRRHLALMRLTPPVAELVSRGKLPVHQAELIARVGDVGRQIELTGQTLALEWDSKKGRWKDCPHWKCHEGDPADYIMPMEELREEVARAMCGLAACGWLRYEQDVAAAEARGKDVELETPISGEGGIAGKRMCAGCPDNTLSYADHPVLFAGIRPQGSDKKGYCTNRECYAAKTKAWEKVQEKRAEAKEQKVAEQVARAEAAGLDVCGQCRKVAAPGQDFQKVKGAGLLCPACAKKAARGGGRKAEPERKFPLTAAEKFAHATWKWGEGVLKALQKHAKTAPPAEDAFAAALLVARLTGNRYRGVEIIVPGTMKAGAIQELLRNPAPVPPPEGLTAGVLAPLRLTHEPRWERWTNSTQNVPLPKDVTGAIACLEALAIRWGLELPPRPRAGDFSGDETTAGADGGGKKPTGGRKRGRA
ncbi:MAG: ParB/RepB/Spo0J family partition protein [Planctomycetes bacterium]|nr:ParB/RepB/Spo0J family partition protein [Planctomycetota bacterium]